MCNKIWTFFLFIFFCKYAGLQFVIRHRWHPINNQIYKISVKLCTSNFELYLITKWLQDVFKMSSQRDNFEEYRENGHDDDSPTFKGF